MKNPNVLGYAVILYAAVLFFYTKSMEGVQVVLYMFVAPFLAWLPIMLVVSYLVGGAGLCFRRAWASLVVLMTAIAQLTLCVGAAAIMFSFDGNILAALWLGSSVTQSLVILAPPALLACSALMLRKAPNMWIPGGQIAEPAGPERRFYQRGIFWGSVVAGVALVWIGSLSPERRISVGGVRLCYPAEYALRADFVESLVAQMLGRYANVDSETMHIPDRLLADRIPGFTYDADDTFILYGTVYSRERFDLVAHIGGVWRIRADNQPHRIERDPTFEGYRVYPWPGADWWHLVLSPPPEVLEPGPPDDWYVGKYVMRGRYKVYFSYGNIVYEHAVQQQNLHLLEEIKAAVHDVLKEWGSNCASDRAWVTP
jgi:hypothetical protein